MQEIDLYIYIKTNLDEVFKEKKMNPLTNTIVSYDLLSQKHNKNVDRGIRNVLRIMGQKDEEWISRASVRQSSNIPELNEIPGCFQVLVTGQELLSAEGLPINSYARQNIGMVFSTFQFRSLGVLAGGYMVQTIFEREFSLALGLSYKPHKKSDSKGRRIICIMRPVSDEEGLLKLVKDRSYNPLFCSECEQELMGHLQKD